MSELIANFFELWGGVRLGDFSDEMFNNSFYNPIFIWMIVVGLVVVALYYYLIDHPRLNRWHWWLAFGGFSALVTFIIAWSISFDNIYTLYEQAQETHPYTFFSHYLPFAFIVSVWNFIFYTLFSLLLKYWSINCKYSPF